MENKELVESLKNVASGAEEAVFSKKDLDLFKKCGLSEEDIKNLEQTEMMSQVIDTLPNDEAGVQRLAAALGAISRENTQENLAALKLIAEKDPTMLAQLMALTTVAEENETK